MDQVLRKALVLDDPENYPRKPAAPTEAVPPGAILPADPAAKPDVVTH